MEGEYILSGVPANAKITVSYIGYRTLYLKASDKGLSKIILAEDSEMLEEVVVTALGIKRSEKALGYSVQKVTSETLQKVAGVDVSTSLTGKVAGLLVKNSTDFAAAPTLAIRGENPLIVIDGVPYANMTMRDIVADDIESVSVLKGATASALYGNRGASGAVMRIRSLSVFLWLLTQCFQQDFWLYRKNSPCMVAVLIINMTKMPEIHGEQHWMVR